MLKKLLGCFTKNNSKDKSNRLQNRKSNKKKGNKLFVKWKGYDNLFNSRIYKKDINI